LRRFDVDDRRSKQDVVGEGFDPVRTGWPAERERAVCLRYPQVDRVAESRVGIVGRITVVEPKPKTRPQQHADASSPRPVRQRHATLDRQVVGCCCGRFVREVSFHAVDFPHTVCVVERIQLAKRLLDGGALRELDTRLARRRVPVHDRKRFDRLNAAGWDVENRAGCDRHLIDLFAVI